MLIKTTLETNLAIMETHTPRQLKLIRLWKVTLASLPKNLTSRDQSGRLAKTSLNVNQGAATNLIELPLQ